MNEGCATFVHYKIMNRLHDVGVLDEGGMLEFLHSHTSVVFQPEYDDQRYSSINPYALGMAMMQDIERICTVPTAEDREWFPQIAGNQEPMATLRDAWVGYRDESFIRQFSFAGADPQAAAVQRVRRRQIGPHGPRDPRRARLPHVALGAGRPVRRGAA